MRYVELVETLLRLTHYWTYEPLAEVCVRLTPDLRQPLDEGHAHRLVWQAIRDAAANRAQLIAVANVVLAVMLGWEGAPILTEEDVVL